jgi:AbrB family looped-hinge helix DNA binding protein
MRIMAKGQVTIPIDIRRRLGLQANSEVEFEVVGNAVRIRKRRGRQERGRALIERMRGRGTVRMTTEEILALTRD